MINKMQKIKSIGGFSSKREIERNKFLNLTKNVKHRHYQAKIFGGLR
jgi:hypothetical protein